MEETRGLTIKDLLIRLILIVIFIFLLIWLFPMPDLKPLNNQIFADNVDRMKDVAKSYYTLERLPKDINESKKMTLREMIDNKLILPLMDSNGKYCSEDDSYIQITKLENEYVIKVYLSCSDKQDYVVTHFGCYDICTDKCKMLETTTQTQASNSEVRKSQVTTKLKSTTQRITTKKEAKIYEYQFTKRVCKEEFERYACDSGYNLVGDTCIKNGSQTVVINADKNISKVTNTDTKKAKAIVNSSTKLVDATCKNSTKTSTINAEKVSTTVNAEEKSKTQLVTASKINAYDVKGAVVTKKTTNANYIKVQNYDIKTATKYATEYKWSYVSTVTSEKSNLGYVNDNEKLILVNIETVPTCKTCTTMVNVYTYFKYRKNVTKYEYSCDAFPGYTKYDTDKCRKATTVTTKCPSGYSPNGSVCSKTEESMSCSSYGSDYVLNISKRSCTKTTTTYKCPTGTSKTSDPKYCKKTVKEFVYPTGTTDLGNGKCTKVTYKCPSNTTDKTYVLSGTKCAVNTKVTTCSCPTGTSKTDDETKCAKTTSSTKYTCEDYSGYTLNGKYCTKTTTTDKVTYSCPSGYTLNGEKCIKTVGTSDSKKAEKKYKTSCNDEYIWSTKTSLSGWSYTGNKREVK